MPNREYKGDENFIDGVVAIGPVAPPNPEVGRVWLDTSTVGSGPTLSIETITSSDTLDSSNDVVLCDASGAAFTVTLPAAASNIGRRYYIKKIDSSANAVPIDANGAETIDGATTLVISLQYDCACIVCDGTEWWVI